MSLNISSQYSTGSYATTGKSKSLNDYLKYLNNKYPCLTLGKSVSITISPSLFRKAMGDEKTGKWLEKELSRAPDYIKEAQNSILSIGKNIEQ